MRSLIHKGKRISASTKQIIRTFSSRLQRSRILQKRPFTAKPANFKWNWVSNNLLQLACILPEKMQTMKQTNRHKQSKQAYSIYAMHNALLNIKRNKGEEEEEKKSWKWIHRMCSINEVNLSNRYSEF